MSIAPDLIPLLACPETKQPISIAPPSVVEGINAKIRDGKLRNRSGELVREPVDALLVREDKKFGYAVRQEIPVMLIEEALPLES